MARLTHTRDLRKVTRSHHGKPVVDRLRVPFDVGSSVQVEIIEEAGPRELEVGDVLITPAAPVPVTLAGFYQTPDEIEAQQAKEEARRERVKAAFLKSLTKPARTRR